MAVVRELVTKLGFTLDKAALLRADKAFADFKRQAESLTKALAYIGGAAAAGAVGIFALAKSYADAGDDALKASQKAGVTIETYQRLAYAADLAGLSHEGLGTSLKFLSTNMISASEGSKETLAAFKKLGIEPKKYLEDTEGAVIAIADKIAAMPDGAAKTDIAKKIFGKSGTEAIPFLNQGGEAIKKLGDQMARYGQIIDKDAAVKAEAFNDRIGEFTGALSGLRNVIGAKLIPILDEKIKKVLEWYAANQDLIKTKVTEWVNKIYDAIVALWNITGQVIDITGAFIEKLGGLKNAAQTAAWAIGLIYGAKAISGLGSLVMAISTVILGLKGTSLAAMAANAAIALIPSLIVAAGLAIGTVIGYVFVRWTQFKEAFIGAAEAVIKPWWDAFSALFEFLYNGFVETATIAYELMNPFKFLDAMDKIQKGTVYQKTGIALNKLQAADKVYRDSQKSSFGVAGDFSREFGNRMAPTINNDISAGKADFKRLLDFGAPNADALLKSRPATDIARMAPAPATMPVSNNRTIHQTNNINAKIPDGVLKREVEKAITDALRKVMGMTDPITSAKGA